MGENPLDQTEALVTFEAEDLQSSEVPDTIVHPMRMLPPGEADISRWLERPVRIATMAVTGAATTGSINAFGLWRNIATIKEKLNRYNLIRGTLCVRFVVNGNPYQYGSILGFMRPRSLPDSSSFDWSGNAVALQLPPTDPNGMSQIYQLPHVVIDPAASSSYELRCPIISPTGWLQLFRVYGYDPCQAGYFCSSLGNTSSGGVLPVTMQVWAWLEQSELTQPTLQASSGKVELRPEGVVQTTSTAVANAASLFRGFPSVGAFATTLEILARTTASAAKALGLSRPTAVDSVLQVSRQTAAYAFSTGGRFFGYRIGTDPLGGVAITADAAGYGADDDMHYRCFTDRWGYLGTATFATTNVLGDRLAAFVVQPCQTPYMTVAAARRPHPTPLGYLSVIHEYWGGGMVLKFRFYASPFHRGTVRLVYDPAATSAVEISTLPTNVLMSKVVDISGITEVEFRVPWSKPELFMTTKLLSKAGNTDPDTVLNDFPECVPSLTSIYGGVNNGRLWVVVETPLTCNGVVAPVRFDVLVKGDEDFRLGRPCIGGVPMYKPMYASSGTVAASAYKLNFGESNESIAQLCKMMVPYMQWGVSDTNGTFPSSGMRTEVLCLPAYPPPVAVTTTEDTPAYRPSHTYTDWFEACYACQRGGYRYSDEFSISPSSLTINFPPSAAVVCAGLTRTALRPAITGGAVSYTMGVSGDPGDENPAWANNYEPRRYLGTPQACYGATIYQVEAPPIYQDYFRVANAGPLLNEYVVGVSTTNEGPALLLSHTSQAGAAVFKLHNLASSGADDYSLHQFIMTPVMN